MTKFVPQNLNSGFNTVDSLNENFQELAILSDTWLSRDGTLPNEMEDDLDMNGNLLLNIGGFTFDEGNFGFPADVITYDPTGNCYIQTDNVQTALDEVDTGICDLYATKVNLALDFMQGYLSAVGDAVSPLHFVPLQQLEASLGDVADGIAELADNTINIYDDQLGTTPVMLLASSSTGGLTTSLPLSTETIFLANRHQNNSSPPYALLQLDGFGKVPLELLPESELQLLGFWDPTPTTGNGPVPPATFTHGEMYIFSTFGDMTLFTGTDQTPHTIAVVGGDRMVALSNADSPDFLDGWYYWQVNSNSVLAVDVIFDKSGTSYVGNELQTVMEEIDGLVVSGNTMVKASGVVDITGVQVGVYPELPDHLVTKEYVDSVLTGTEVSVILSSGQTLVNFTGLNTGKCRFYILDNDTDSSQIFNTYGYDLTTETSITLKHSYPQGTILRAEEFSAFVPTNPDDSTSIVVQPLAPVVEGEGGLWYNTTDGQLYVDINDGDSSQWAQANVPISEVQGPTGAQGPQGVPGEDGLDGATGAIGPTGPAGSDGLDGTNGIDGVDGLPGAPGDDGLDGAQGIQGETGPQGTPGLDGSDGAIGPEGPQGTDGLTGQPGLNGNTIRYGIVPPLAGDGADGDFYIDTVANFLYGPKAAGVWPAGTSLIGPQGIQGLTGDTGLTGADGIQGPIGPTGDTGATGADGIQGIPGVDGADGATGLTGPAGADGIDGTDGLDGALVSMVAVAPVPTGGGNMWYNLTDGQLYIDITDTGGSFQWVIANAPVVV